MTHHELETIAVVGMSGRFPKSPDLNAFWRNLAEGREMLTFFDDAPEHSAPSGGLLDDIDQFDADYFGFSARETALKDPQHRLLLECAHQTLEHAGYCADYFKGLIGVYAGVGSSGYLSRNVMPGEGDPGFLRLHHLHLNNEKDFVATQIAYKLNLRGPAINVNTACSTSLVAVHLAAKALLGYECDLALAGAASISAAQHEGFAYELGGILAPDGHCRPFDAQAAGTVASNGVGMVALKRTSEALEDGDTIYGLILGSAVNNDGRDKVSFSAPNVKAQTEVIADALAVADVEARGISYVEAHGTATPMGDPIEVTALTDAFRATTDEVGFCALGSLKSNLGHMNAASGVGGLTKTLLALHHELLPASLHYNQPNPDIDFAQNPFVVNAEAKPWPRGAEPRRAGVSSFGMGGTNVHLILEEAPAATPRPGGDGVHLLPLSARTATALQQMAAQLADHLEARPEQALADVAHTLQVGRVDHEHRRFVTARTHAEAVAALRKDEAGHGGVVDKPRHNVVFLFPGQGSQYVDMARNLYTAEPVFAEYLNRCFDLLDGDVRALVFSAKGEDGDIQDTRHAQPLIFAVSYALAKLWEAKGVTPSAMIGHSIGEWVAATLAGVVDLPDALHIVQLRGRLMADMAHGEMVSVNLSPEQVASYVTADVTISAVNLPDATVLGGPSTAIAEVRQTLEAKGYAVRPLHTSHAFHTAMMADAADQFAQSLRAMSLKAPQRRFTSNLTGAWLTDAHAVDPSYWARQLRETVDFSACLATVLADPDAVLLEVGPGTTLTSLARRHPARDQQPVIASLPHPREADQDVRAFQTALGRLWSVGVALDWAKLNEGAGAGRIPLPTYPFQRRRYWIEAKSSAQAQLDWIEAPVRVRVDFLPEPARLARSREHFLGELAETLSLHEVALFAAELENLAKAYVVDTFRRLGWDFAARDAVTLDQLMSRLGFAARHQRQLRHLTRVLTNMGVFQLQGEHVANLAPPQMPAPDELLERMRLTYPHMHEELGFFSRCWSAMDRLARAELDTLQLLFPDGAAQDMEHLYQNSPDKQAMGRLVGEVMADLAAATPSDQQLRILEVGGGVGGTTAYILPNLPADRTRYTFSDISRFFTDKARTTFADYAFLTTTLVDLERPPEAQGHEPHSFDVVVAANVLHTTRDLRETLRHVRSYLKDGGLLVFMEVTKPALASDLTFGFLDGWWRFTDTDLRPDHALVTADIWEQVLAETGFEDSHTLTPELGSETGFEDSHTLTPELGSEALSHHAVLVARAGVEQLGPLNLLGDQGGVGRVLTQDLNRIIHETDQDDAPLLCTLPLDLTSPDLTAGELDRLRRHILDLLPDLAARTQPAWLVTRGALDPQPSLSGLLHKSFWDAAPDALRLLDLASDAEQDGDAVRAALSQHAGCAKWREGRLLVLCEVVVTEEPEADAAFERPDMGDDFQAPRDTLEIQIADIFRDVFALDRVGVRDNFFELGGDSLLATQILSRLRSQAGLDMPLDQFLTTPTIAQVADYLRGGVKTAISQIQSLPAETRLKPLPVSFAQHRLWFVSNTSEGAAYNVPEAVRLRGALDLDALKDSVRDIIARQEGLRTAFVEQDGEPFQIIHPQAELDFARHQLDDEAQLAPLVERDVRAPFHLSRAPLMRVRLYTLTEDHHVLLLVMHHIISDGWSVGVLVKEWFEGYEARVLKRTSALPDLPVQYADFAQWQRDWLSGAELERQTNYWLSRLDAMPAHYEIAPDFTRLPDQRGGGKSLWFRVDADTTSALRDQARTEQGSLFITLLAAWKAVLIHHTGQTDVVVGTDVAGRNRPEIENLIGFFINQLVLRTKLEDATRFDQLSAAVKDTVLGAHEHQDLPFDKLLTALRRPRDPLRSPLFQIKLVLQNMPMPDLKLPDLDLELYGTDIGESRFDVLINIRIDGDELLGSLRYNTALYEAHTMADLLARYEVALQTVAAQPQIERQALHALLTEEQDRRVRDRQAAFKKTKFGKFKKRTS